MAMSTNDSLLHVMAGPNLAYTFRSDDLFWFLPLVRERAEEERGQRNEWADY